MAIWGRSSARLIDRYFYQRTYSPEPADAIAIDDVEECFRSIAAHAVGSAF
jgi:hypothetical protein